MIALILAVTSHTQKNNDLSEVLNSGKKSVYHYFVFLSLHRLLVASQNLSSNGWCICNL